MSIPTRVQQAIADGLAIGYVTPTALTRNLAPILGVSGATDGDLFRAIRLELQKPAKAGIIRSKLAGRDGERFFLPNTDEENAPAPPSDRLANDRLDVLSNMLTFLGDTQTSIATRLDRMENAIADIRVIVDTIAQQVSKIDTSLPDDDAPDY